MGELLTSVQTLADVSPRQDGVEAVRAAAADSRVAMDAAVAAVAEGLQPAVEEVQTALAAVRTAVDDLDQSYPGQGAAGIAEALDGLRDALVSLGAAVDLECPEQ